MKKIALIVCLMGTFLFGAGPAASHAAEVDKINQDIYDKIKEVIETQPDRVGYLINLLLIARHLERIADHATNIAEEVGEAWGRAKLIFCNDNK